MTNKINKKKVSMSAPQDIQQGKLYTYFNPLNQDEVLFTKSVITLDVLAEELELSGLKEIYEQGKEAVLSKGGEGENSYVLSLHAITRLLAILRQELQECFHY